MPKTRDQQFMESWEKIVLNNTDIIDVDYENVSVRIDNITENLTKSAHKYQVTFTYRRRVHHYMDVRYEVDGILHEPGPVYEEPILPDLSDLQNKFNNYFANYNKEVDDKLVSYVQMGTLKAHTTSQNNKIAVGNLKVVYHCGHHPYPIVKSRLEELEDMCESLSEKLEDKEAHLNNINKLLKQVRSRLTFQKTESSRKMRELYSKSEKEDCPVCLIKIKDEDLIISPCCHFICNPCYSRVSDCPICRKKYVK